METGDLICDVSFSIDNDTHCCRWELKTHYTTHWNRTISFQWNHTTKTQVCKQLNHNHYGCVGESIEKMSVLYYNPKTNKINKLFCILKMKPIYRTIKTFVKIQLIFLIIFHYCYVSKCFTFEFMIFIINNDLVSFSLL